VKPLTVAAVSVVGKFLDGVGVDVVAQDGFAYPRILSGLNNAVVLKEFICLIIHSLARLRR